MITCKQVSNALARYRYWELPWHRKMGLLLHIKLCCLCGKFNGQIVDLQDCVKGYLDHEDELIEKSDEHLSDDAKEKIRAAIAAK